MTVVEEHQHRRESGAITFYVAAGPRDGPLMILCHGWPAIARTWQNQIETFAALGYRVVAPDMPGKSYIRPQRWGLTNIFRLWEVDCIKSC